MMAVVLPESHETRMRNLAFERARVIPYRRQLRQGIPSAERLSRYDIASSGRTQQQQQQQHHRHEERSIDREEEEDTMVYLTRSTQVVDWSIEHITIQTKTMGAFSLDRCSQLQNVYFNEHIPTFTMENNAFSRCTSLTTITFPSSVESIDKRVLAHCSNLQSLDMSACSNLQAWDTTQALQKCKNLRHIRFPPSGMQKLGNNMMHGCTSLIELRNLPSTLKCIGSDAFRDCTSLQVVVLPDNVEVLENNAFSGCKLLKSIRLPRHLHAVGQGVWRKCESLQRIEWSVVDDLPIEKRDGKDPRKVWAPFLQALGTAPTTKLPKRNQSSIVYDFVQRHMNEIIHMANSASNTVTDKLPER